MKSEAEKIKDLIAAAKVARDWFIENDMHYGAQNGIRVENEMFVNLDNALVEIGADLDRMERR